MKVVRVSALRTGHLYPPGKIPGTHFCYRLSQPRVHSADGRIMSMKNSNDPIWNRIYSIKPIFFCKFQFTYPSLIKHTLMNLRQFLYILEMMKSFNDCFMQLCTPWWWASETRNKQQLTYYNTIVILTKYVHLLVHTLTTESQCTEWKM
jgi:hypothetical protein